MKSSPCLNCKRRTPTCKFDNTCEEYPRFRKNEDERKERIDKARARENLLSGYQKQAADNSRRRKWK